MKRKTTAILLSVVMALMAAGCGAAGGSGNGVPHRHDTIYSYLIQLLRRQWH